MSSKITKEEAYEKVLNRLLHFISYTQRTEREVTQKLDKVLVRYAKKMNNQEIREIIDGVFEELAEQGFIDDDGYAKAYVQHKMTAKTPKSRLEISKFLYQKGISREITNTALFQYTDEQEIENIQKILEKKAKKPKEKLIAYLLRRGFKAGNVYETVNT